MTSWTSEQILPTYEPAAYEAEKLAWGEKGVHRKAAVGGGSRIIRLLWGSSHGMSEKGI